jgi:hypothetical protein
MRAHPLAWFLCLLLCLPPAMAAVVPDASVVEPDKGAPRLAPADPSAQHSPHVGEVPAHPTPAAPAPVPAAPGSTSPGLPQPAVPTSGGAFSEQNNTDPSSTGESRPLQPLAPAPVSTASTTPLWAALILFLFLAIGGFWLAQRRDQE